MTRPESGPRDQHGVRSFLRVGGPILLGIGLILTIAGLASFFAAFGSFGVPSNFWMAFVGMPLIGIGASMTWIGYLGPATRYVAGELTPTLRDTLGSLGLSSGTKCPACGAANDRDARFCDACGHALSAACPSCGAANHAGARFCDSCGAALNSP
jgi:predicted nucleic acid-binding Zn ribbon protein